MAKEAEDMVLPMLREMRGEISKRFDAVSEQFDAINERLDRLEASQKTIKQALTADTMMSKFVTGDFEERITDLEINVRNLMKK